MKKVFKYELTHETTVNIPTKSTFLYFNVQKETPMVWFEVDPEYISSPKHFRIFGTGQEIPYSYKYLGSCMDDPFVWHLYEVL